MPWDPWNLVCTLPSVITLTDSNSIYRLEIVHKDFSAVSLRISDASAQLTESRDGSYLDITVRNRLPCVSLVTDAHLLELTTSKGYTSQRSHRYPDRAWLRTFIVYH